eukprot:PITA_16131
MISPLLAKLYGIILERKLSIWLESEGERAKSQAGFRKQHSTTEHLVTLRIIMEECRNDKSNLFCCFVDFKKDFDTVPRNNLWNRLEELKVPFELRVATIRLYENVIAKLKSNDGWLKDIKCNIRVKQGCPLPYLIWHLHRQARRCPSDLDKQLILLKDFCSTMGMIVNTDKTKVMIIKSKKDTYANFMYDNSNLEEVSSYKYLGIDIHHKLNWNYSIDKRINEGCKAYFGLENNCKTTNLVMWDRIKFLFETLVTPVILYGCEVWGCSISRESWRKIEQIQKRFITYNLKIKRNTPYPILLIEVGLSPIESLAMARLLLYKHKLNNIGDYRFPKLALNSSQNHLRLKRG